MTSHEIIEAATDPIPGNNPAFQVTDPSNSWIALGGEVADLCSRGDDSRAFREAGFVVTRSWSKKHPHSTPSALAGSRQASGVNFSVGNGLGIAVVVEKKTPGPLSFPANETHHGAIRIQSVRLDFSAVPRDENNTLA